MKTVCCSSQIQSLSEGRAAASPGQCATRDLLRERAGNKRFAWHYWVQRHSFPEPGMQALYAADGGNLQWAQPDNCDGAGACIQNFTYDPVNPVQTWGGNNLVATYTHKCGPQDQRKVEDGRSDVLQFAQVPQTEPLAIVGNVTVSLFVGSDRPDTDFVAKLVDIHPDGTRMLVQDGMIRMRWRDGPLAGTTAAPLDPKQVYAVTLMLGQVSHIFNVGHKIGLTITSSNFPRFSATRIPATADRVNNVASIQPTSACTLARKIRNGGKLADSRHARATAGVRVTLDPKQYIVSLQLLIQYMIQRGCSH